MNIQPEFNSIHQKTFEAFSRACSVEDEISTIGSMHRRRLRPRLRAPKKLESCQGWNTSTGRGWGGQLVLANINNVNKWKN